MPANRGSARAFSREEIVAEIQFRSGVLGLNPAPIVEIVSRESGFDPWALNPSSGAAGLFQRVPGSLVALGDVEGQVADGVAYIKRRYGTSEAALAWWDSHGWS